MAGAERIRGADHLLPPSAGDGAGLASLMRELASDAGSLVQQEIALAKLEVKQTVAATMLDTIKIMIALGFAAIGGLCLVIFSIIGLGVLLDGAYWAGALITGGLLLLIGGLLSFSAVKDLRRRSIAPDDAIAGLRADGKLARLEARALKDRVARGLETGAIAQRTD